jgi:broad specificity phosphatase PhoE
MKEFVVYLLRHARPVLPDDQKRYLGHSDPPLSAEGLEQARALADSLWFVPFTSAYSSDLRRARRTAEMILAGIGLPVHVDVHLREIDAGRWEGLTAEEARERSPQEADERDQRPIDFRFPGGESYRDLSDEVVPVFERILSEATGDVLVVAHKGVNRVILCHCLGWPLEKLYEIPQDYGCVNTVSVIVKPDGSRAMEVKTPVASPSPV